VRGSAILFLALSTSGCNPYFVPSLGLLRESGGVFCWTPVGSENVQSCQNRAASVSLEACVHELGPSGTWRTISDVASAQLLACMAKKGWSRTLVSGEVITLA